MLLRSTLTSKIMAAERQTECRPFVAQDALTYDVQGVESGSETAAQQTPHLMIIDVP